MNYSNVIAARDALIRQIDTDVYDIINSKTNSK